MKVVLVGLPYFTKRLQKELSAFDPENTYTNLDTYYSRKDKVRAVFQIPRADCVMSINGTVVKSKVFDIAFKKNVPLIINWAGSDVMKSLDAYRKGNFQQHYIDKAVHFCEAEWIQEELKEMNIDAEIVYFAISEGKVDLNPVTSEQFTILSYIPDRRTDFYGLPTLIRMAEQFPEIRFLVAGSDESVLEEGTIIPENMEMLGWVNNMPEVFQQAHACMRFTEHDGLSNIIREALSHGKQVLYKYPFKHCIHCPDESVLADQIKALKMRFENGEDLTNAEGAQFIHETFQRDKVLSNLIKKIKAVVEKS